VYDEILMNERGGAVSLARMTVILMGCGL